MPHCTVSFLPGWGGLLMLAASAVSGAEVRVVGSDVLGMEFSEALLRYVAREGLAVSTAFDGSRPGLEALRAGRAQLAIVTVPAAEEALLAGLESVPLAWHRVMVLVPRATPVEHITLAQLAAIYGRDMPESLYRWGDLGVGGEWSRSPITAHAPVVGGGLIVEYFRHTVLGGRAFKPLIVRYAATAELELRLAGDSRAIVLAAAPLPAAIGFKSLALAARPGEPAFAPTPENLESGDYALCVALRAVFLPSAVRPVAPLVKFLLSDEAGVILEQAGLAPRTPAARRRSLLSHEKQAREILQK